MNKEFLDKIMTTPDLLQMGHGQTIDDKNLGMGWIYYSLSRLYKPEVVVCIGSWRGFVPILIAKGWELDNITHYKMTTQEFKSSDVYKNLEKIDILFVDGLHTYEQAKFDHETFLPLLNSKSITLFHDSVMTHESNIYGDDNKYTYSVNRYMRELKDSGYQVLDLPFEFGLSLVRN